MNAAAGIAERAFFREEFQRRTVVIAWRDGASDDIVEVVRELLAGTSRVLVVAEDRDGRPAEVAEALGAVSVPAPVTADDLAALWTDLEDTGRRVVATPGDPAGPAAAVAGRLGVHKLVITDPAGGCGRSFASRADLETPGVLTPELVDAVRAALDGGVGGVNLCRSADLDTELFTFDGAGTLFTADTYVLVNRLRAADLGVVTQLVARGVAEGYLRPRTRVEVARLALDGLGARVGPSRLLAGFGALETERYAATDVAEITCLYTVNRYEGEGVGGQLVAGLVEAARRRGVRAVFACTVSARATALFERAGFRQVALDRLPAEKWVGYDPARRNVVTATWLDLDADAGTAGESRQT